MRVVARDAILHVEACAAVKLELVVAGIATCVADNLALQRSKTVASRRLERKDWIPDGYRQAPDLKTNPMCESGIVNDLGISR